jgi:hypothetical protein
MQVPPTSVATMYLRVVSLISFRNRSILRGGADENYGEPLPLLSRCAFTGPFPHQLEVEFYAEGLLVRQR